MNNVLCLYELNETNITPTIFTKRVGEKIVKVIQLQAHDTFLTKHKVSI